MLIKVYLMTVLDNYMFRPTGHLQVVFQRTYLKVLLYTLSAHVVQRSLHTGVIA